MEEPSKQVHAVAGIALLGAAIGVIALHGTSPAPDQSAPTESGPIETSERSEPQPRADSPPDQMNLPQPEPKLARPIPSANPREEVALMVRLRELGTWSTHTEARHLQTMSRDIC